MFAPAPEMEPVLWIRTYSSHSQIQLELQVFWHTQSETPNSIPMPGIIGPPGPRGYKKFTQPETRAHSSLHLCPQINLWEASTRT